MTSDIKTHTVYELEIHPGKNSNGLPFFSSGKLIHTIQSVCSSYISSFTIDEDCHMIFSKGNLSKENCIVVKIYDEKKQTVNNAAADLCAFLKLKEIPVRTYSLQEYTVSDKI